MIVFGSDQEVAELMKAVKRLNATGHFSWIGSDGWSARALVSDGKPHLILYMIKPIEPYYGNTLLLSMAFYSNYLTKQAI